MFKPTNKTEVRKVPVRMHCDPCYTTLTEQTSLLHIIVSTRFPVPQPYGCAPPCCKTRCSLSTSWGLSLPRAPTTALAWLPPSRLGVLLPAGFWGVAEPDLTGVECPEGGLVAEEDSCPAAIAALGDCLDKAEEGRLARLTAWLRPPMLICFGLLMLMRAASSYLPHGSTCCSPNPMPAYTCHMQHDHVCALSVCCSRKLRYHICIAGLGFVCWRAHQAKKTATAE